MWCAQPCRPCCLSRLHLTLQELQVFFSPRASRAWGHAEASRTSALLTSAEEGQSFMDGVVLCSVVCLQHPWPLPTICPSSCDHQKCPRCCQGPPKGRNNPQSRTSDVKGRALYGSFSQAPRISSSSLSPQREAGLRQSSTRPASRNPELADHLIPYSRCRSVNYTCIYFKHALPEKITEIIMMCPSAGELFILFPFSVVLLKCIRVFGYFCNLIERCSLELHL